MNPAIDVIGEDVCAGCFGCYNSCPFDAITMEISKNGFYIPVIDRDKCTECGLCQNHCPVLVADKPQMKDYSPASFAAWSTDEQARMASSSGGVFSSLATTVMSSGGAVFGAAWNSSMLVEHVEVCSSDSLESLRGSKYMQSNVGKSFAKVASLIESRKPVLFSGTPCQVAALNTFVKSDLLITVDVICHGVPSIVAFQKYLEEKRGEKKVKRVSFRDKRTGWSRFSILIEYDDGSIYTRRFTFDDFCWGFNNNFYLNNICYECPFSRLPRQSDITLGDFWGVPRELTDERGVSAVIINSARGEELFSSVSGIERVPVNLDMVAKGNPRLISGKQRRPQSREKLLGELSEKEFAYIAGKYLKHPGEFESFLKGCVYRLLRKMKLKK